MSKQNVETTRRAIDAGNRMDPDGIIAEYTEDAVLWMPLEGPNPGEHEGREAIRGFFEDFYSQWAELVIDVDAMIELDDKVVCLVHWRGTGRLSGVEVSRAGAFTYSFTDAKISRVDFYAEQAQALEAAGLRE